MAKRLRRSVLLRMASDVDPLPREPDILIGMVLDLRDENGKLRAMLETLKRTLFGARSERLFGDQPGQLALGYEDVSTAPIEPKPEAVKPPSSDGRSRAKPMRNIGSLPRHLPRVDVVIEPERSCCPCCQGGLHRIGEDVGSVRSRAGRLALTDKIRNAPGSGHDVECDAGSFGEAGTTGDGGNALVVTATRTEEIAKFAVLATETASSVMALEAAHTSDPALDAVMILFKAVVQVGAVADEVCRKTVTMSMHPERLSITHNFVEWLLRFVCLRGVTGRAIRRHCQEADLRL